MIWAEMLPALKMPARRGFVQGKEPLAVVKPAVNKVMPNDV